MQTICTADIFRLFLPDAVKDWCSNVQERVIIFYACTLNLGYFLLRNEPFCIHIQTFIMGSLILFYFADVCLEKINDPGSVSINCFNMIFS